VLRCRGVARSRRSRVRAADRPPEHPEHESQIFPYDNIADMDTQVGEILEQLEEDGLAENTIVFYWSDHADGVPRAKRSLYDSGLHVPLMTLAEEFHTAFFARRGERPARKFHRPRPDGARARGR
jgi:glucan phosphoethanolaminetransferase (alkaline phosphatase superfamily)